MVRTELLEARIFNIHTLQDFEALALDIFHYQYRFNPVYQSFCDHLKGRSFQPSHYKEIPHLPISFFKSHRVVSGAYPVEVVFESSGTTNTLPSRHFVCSRALYQRAYMAGFKQVYGNPTQYAIMALLPSYLERKNASLVDMASGLIRSSEHEASGFYLDDLPQLGRRLKELSASGVPVILIGVSFALLDLAKAFPMPLEQTIIIETGGMKGRRREWIREELHAYLSRQFPGARIHSEYGMTELLSQAYATENGRFNTPPWMKVQIRDMEDPLSEAIMDRTGGVNITDLANLHSCAFIATDDLGKTHEDGSFEILGRFDHSDIRGCNLMIL